MGSLGRALIQIQSEKSADGVKTLRETAEDVKELWDSCCTGDWLAVAPVLDRLSKERNLAVHVQFLTSMQYLVRNAFLQKTGRSENYFDPGNILLDPTGVLADAVRTDRLIHACNDALSSVKRYGNVAIIFVNFVMAVMEILHVEEQQIG
jgi:hypothetical protein